MIVCVYLIDELIDVELLIKRIDN